MKKQIDPHEYPGLESAMRQVGNKIKEGLPPDVGFALFTFHLGEGGGLSYMSNAKREDMISVVKEWLELQED